MDLNIEILLCNICMLPALDLDYFPVDHLKFLRPPVDCYYRLHV